MACVNNYVWNLGKLKKLPKTASNVTNVILGGTGDVLTLRMKMMKNLVWTGSAEIVP